MIYKFTAVHYSEKLIQRNPRLIPGALILLTNFSIRGYYLEYVKSVLGIYGNIHELYYLKNVKWQISLLER